MFAVMTNHELTFTLEKAQEIVKEMNVEGDDWTYEIVPVGDKLAKVKIVDEDGEFVAWFDLI